MYFTKLSLRRFLRTIPGLVFTFGAILGWAAPDPSVLDLTHASVRAVMAVQGEVTPDLMAQADVLGTAVGVDATGAPSLVVYIDQDGASAAEVVRSLPPQVR